MFLKQSSVCLAIKQQLDKNVQLKKKTMGSFPKINIWAYSAYFLELLGIYV